MKKILAFLFVATLCYGANAVTKCIDADTIGNGSVTDSGEEYDGSYWYVTFDNKITVEGDGVCLNNSCSTEMADGSNGCFIDTIDMFNADEDTFYCWCRIVRPFVSKWFYLGIAGGMNDEYDDAMCRTDCSFACREAFIDNRYALRTNI